MLFSLATAAILSVASVQAVDWPVQVGASGGLTYTPNSVTAANGDTVTFTFVAKNHTATQSTFAAPCSPLASGLTSGFKFVDATATNAAPLTFVVNVTDATTPMWFYCAQTNPISHCQSGMVFAINPTADKTIDAFTAAAKASASTPAAGNGTTPASGNSTSTPAGTGAGSSPTSTAPPAGNTGGSGSGGNGSGALQLGTSAAGAFAVAAMFLGIAL